MSADVSSSPAYKTAGSLTLPKAGFECIETERWVEGFKTNAKDTTILDEMANEDLDFEA